MTRSGGLTAAEAEARIFGATHADVGAYLLWLWGLPDCVTELSRCTISRRGSGAPRWPSM